MRVYNTGILDRLIGMPRKEARYPWPDDCGIQGGDDGLVLETGSMSEALSDSAKAADAVVGALGAAVATPHYRTAFFEAFPKTPATFIRGEGASIDAAEDDAWRQYQAILACTNHEFERRKYRTGSGICRKCGLFSSTAFETTLDPCFVCGRADNRASYGPDKAGRWHCEQCYRLIPEDEKSEIHKRADALRRDLATS
jgi:hypothetical protein